MILYTTVGCHLCEQAAELLHALNQDYTPAEIGDNETLVAEYGTRIPVIAANNGHTLDWPFSQTDLLNFISEHA